MPSSTNAEAGGAYEIKMTDAFESSFKKLGPVASRRVASAIDSLKIDPFVGKGEMERASDHHSLQVVHYAILYKINSVNMCVTLYDVSHRRKGLPKHGSKDQSSSPAGPG